jgi:hypothetical protein
MKSTESGQVATSACCIMCVELFLDLSLLLLSSFGIVHSLPLFLPRLYVVAGMVWTNMFRFPAERHSSLHCQLQIGCGAHTPTCIVDVGVKVAGARS